MKGNLNLNFTGISLTGVLCVLFITGCMSDHTERAADTDPSGWEPSHSVRLSINNTDTASVRDMMLFSRTNRLAAGNAVRIEVRTTAPDGIYFVDTLSYAALPPRVGRSYRETHQLFRSDVVLGQTGDYIFEFRPLEAVQGVAAVGIKFEQVKNNP